MPLTYDVGVICAAWEYDAYGNIVNQTGEKLDVNPLRFSSEYHDEELGLVYYNYRHYNPKEGRWISRDPIGEVDEGNTCCFLNNANTNKDYLGLWKICRNGNYWASAFPSNKYDTWKGLADILHLSTSEVSKWVAGYTSKVDFTKWYSFPNTIIQAWYGDFGWIGSRYAGWDMEPSGDYEIIQIFYPSSSKDSIANEVGAKAMLYSYYKALYGVYIHARGNNKGVYGILGT